MNSLTLITCPYLRHKKQKVKSGGSSSFTRHIRLEVQLSVNPPLPRAEGSRCFVKPASRKGVRNNSPAELTSSENGWR